MYSFVPVVKLIKITMYSNAITLVTYIGFFCCFQSAISFSINKDEDNKLDKEYSFKTVSEILSELSKCHEHNRNLNKTVENILDVVDTLVQVVLNHDNKILEITKDVGEVKDDVVSVAETVNANVGRLEDNSLSLNLVSTRGRWCGFRNNHQQQEEADNSIISYDSMFFSDTNMNITESPLDMPSGKAFHVT